MNPKADEPMAPIYVQMTEEMQQRRRKLHFAVLVEPVIASLAAQSYDFAVKLNDALEFSESVAGHLVREGTFKGAGYPGREDPFYYIHPIGNDCEEEIGVILTFDLDTETDLVITFLERKDDPVRLVYSLRHEVEHGSKDSQRRQARIRNARLGLTLDRMFPIVDIMSRAEKLMIADHPENRKEIIETGEVMRSLCWNE